MPAHRLDHDIATALLRRERLDRIHYVRHLGGLDDFMRTHMFGGLDLPVALHHDNHVATDRPRYLHEHQPNRSPANDYDRVANLYPGFMKPAQHTCQRLGHGRVFKADVGWNHQHVGFDNTFRHPDIFRVSPVVEE
jgi:hypothetical protein